MTSYHVPVMHTQCIEALKLRAGAKYVDATLGGGGHSLAMLQACPDIRLYGFDRDEEALRHASERLFSFADRVNLIHSDFANLRTELAWQKVKSIDGILFDLGVSSHQIDTAERGFSFDRDADLDMRMDRSQSLSAYEVVNETEPNQLARIIKEYSDELHAKRIARAIVAARDNEPIRSTGQLARIIESVVGVGTKESLKSKVRVFQAIRIYVNDELGALKTALEDAINLLAPEGRIVVMSYHSLEDRIVKNIFRDAATGCKCPPSVLKCVCGEVPRIKLIGRKPQEADESEIKINSRSRSAKLRIAEKLRGKQ